MNRTLAATLIATLVGTGSWLFGLGRAIWPAHPMVVIFLITILVGIVVMQSWPLTTRTR